MPAKSVMPKDSELMRRAIAVARNGFPAPNPHVGCVIVSEGEIVGEGFCHHAGAPHAEVMALRIAGSRAKDATAYVTLEPCNHYGRTPPCSLALIDAGIRRVVVANMDPNPKAAGGVERLRLAGIDVITDFLADEAFAVNRQFLTAMKSKRPYIILKAATSLDGRIATATGESQWITGPESREQGHRLRAKCGAVLVGRKTVEMDDPLLTARITDVTHQPVRIVLDSHAKLDRSYRVFDDSAETIHVTGAIDLRSLLDDWFKRDILGVLVEGGAQTIASFLRAGLGDELHLFVAPIVIGDGPTWSADFSLTSLSGAPVFALESQQSLGRDLWLQYLR
jgi:diaminohydroxyphosphoribosylaminopyrimidine deaminase/5-amino-6-(5-phosphoribosylamino)uracil reductase